MNLKQAGFLGCILVEMFCGCKKNPIYKQKENPTIPSNFMPLKKGNFWVYNTFSQDSAGNILSQYGLDTLTVMQDSIINRTTYYFLKSNLVAMGLDKYSYQWFRDSLSYRVDLNGKIYFSTQNMNDTLYSIRNVSIQAFYSMRANPIQNSFDKDTIDLFGDVTVTDGSNTFRKPTHEYYIESIGLYKSTSYAFSDPKRDIVSTLVSYKIF